MNDIFISYASPDRNTAELLAKEFIQRGWSVWWDRQIPPGKSYDEIIENALNSTRCVIVLWSKDSVISRWVKTEAAEAAAKNFLVPVLIDKVQIPLEFKRIEAADLTDWQGNSPHIEFEQLLKTVADMLGNGTQTSTIKQPLSKTKSQSQQWWKRLPSIKSIVVTTILVSIYALSRWDFLQDMVGKTKIATLAASDENPVTKPIITVPDGKSINSAQTTESGEQIRQVEAIYSQNKKINLLSSDNGGQLLAASSDDWKATIDGKEDWAQISYGLGKEAVYGFKDDKAAVFDTFTMLITETGDNNVKDFELLVGNDSPTGVFESLGKFQTQNLKLFKTPYQEFKFPPVIARYLKVKIIDSYGYTHPIIHEFQLFGMLK
jgi:hypothetical protein